MKNRELPPAIGLDEEPEPKRPDKPTLRKRFSEWMKEGNPEYVKEKKKKGLVEKLADLQSQLDHIDIHRNVQMSSQRDERTPDDARIMDRLKSQIAEVNQQIADLDGSGEKAA
jgi:hypothetical protein